MPTPRKPAAARKVGRSRADTTSGAPAERPTGRDETIAAIVTSARQLWSERGPAAVSLRQIAAHAGVNYGLVYQYIGTRENLLHVVYRQLSEHASEQLKAGDDFHAALDTLRVSSTGDAYVRMLAWTLLEGHDPHAFLGRSPAMEEFVRTVRRGLDADGDDADGRDGDATDAAVVAGVAMVITMGWKLFSPFFTVALGLEDDRARFDQAVQRLIERLPELVLPAIPRDDARG
jgi:AcrR family transcriptional regulator